MKKKELEAEILRLREEIASLISVNNQLIDSAKEDANLVKKAFDVNNHFFNHLQPFYSEWNDSPYKAVKKIAQKIETLELENKKLLEQVKNLKQNQ